MPIRHSNDRVNKRLLTRADGVVTSHEINAHLDYEQRNRDLDRQELIDARGATTTVTADQVRQFVTRAADLLRVVNLAAQNTLGNIVAGVWLLMYRLFRVQDVVQVTPASGLETGTIESLTLGYTILKTFDNRRIVVPNSVMATQVTVNLTSRDPRVMLMLPFGVG